MATTNLTETVDAGQTVVRTPLSRITLLPGIKDIRPINDDHVQSMKLYMKSLPPIDVVKLEDGKYGVLAGYHRYWAYNEEDQKTIPAIVHDMPQAEWFMFAVRSNRDHGLPLTLKQKTAAANRMLTDTPKRSDRAIASDVGLSPTTVGTLRSTIVQIGQSPTVAAQPQSRVGKDGVTRRVPEKKTTKAVAPQAVPTAQATNGTTVVAPTSDVEDPWTYDPSNDPAAMAPITPTPELTQALSDLAEIDLDRLREIIAGFADTTALGMALAVGIESRWGLRAFYDVFAPTVIATKG